MTIRLAGLVVLAILSSACAFRSPATVPQPVDYSDSAAYDQPWAASPDYRSARAGAEQEDAQAEAPSTDAAPAGNLLGSPAPVTRSVAHDAQISSRDACHDAAVESGMKRGSCTLLSDRKYVLLGEK